LGGCIALRLMTMGIRSPAVCCLWFSSQAGWLFGVFAKGVYLHFVPETGVGYWFSQGYLVCVV